MDELFSDDSEQVSNVPDGEPTSTPVEEIPTSQVEEDTIAPVETIDPVESAEDFIGDAEAILAVSESADAGIQDLVEAYRSTKWDNPERALQIVEEYGLKLRQKNSTEQNILTPQETLDIAPSRPSESDFDIREWERKNKEIAEKGTSPEFRAYQDQIVVAIENAATAAIQQVNDETVPQWEDKLNRIGLGILPGVAKELGVARHMERRLRADSNDTLASAIATGVGSILSIPLAGVDIATRPIVFGKEAYRQSRSAGGTVMEASSAAAIEAASNVLDVLTDKFLLGRAKKVAEPAGKIVLAGAGYEAGTEYVQTTLSETAALVGQSQDTFSGFLSEDKLIAAGAGGIVGGAARGAETAFPGSISGYGLLGTRAEAETSQVEATVLPPEPPTNPVRENLEFPIFPESTPPPTIAVVGEPVSGSPNVTEVEDASTGTPTATNVENIVAETPAGESFIQNPDGTVARVVNGEKKQAHINTVQVSPEIAEKIAKLTASDLGGVPVAVYYDDLGRPFIKHPLVDNELNIITEGDQNLLPVPIPTVSTGGHALQYSARPTEFGSIERRASLSMGPVSTVSTAGAMAVKESSSAKKLRESQALSPEVKRVLSLDTDFSPTLTYTPTTEKGTMYDVGGIFQRFDNDLIQFADDFLNSDLGDVSISEGVAAGIAAEAFNTRAKELRASNTPESIKAAQSYEALTANLIGKITNIKSVDAQRLRMWQMLPITGTHVEASLRLANDLASAAKVAVENETTLEEVQKVELEDPKLVEVDNVLAEKERTLVDKEAAVDDIDSEQIKAIKSIDDEIKKLGDKDPDITTLERTLKEINDEAARIEEEALSQEEAANKLVSDAIAKAAAETETGSEEFVQKARAKVDEEILLTKTVDEEILLTKTVDELQSSLDSLTETKESLEQQRDELTSAKKLLPKPRLDPRVIAAEAAYDRAITKDERGKARRAVEKAEAAATEERNVAIVKLDSQLSSVEKQISEVQSNIKKTKSALAAETKKLDKSKSTKVNVPGNKLLTEAQISANLLRESARLAKKQAAAENARKKKAAQEELKKLREDRAAANKLRLEELKLEKERIRAEAKATRETRKAQAKKDKEAIREQLQAVRKDREKIAERRARNERIRKALERYKEQFDKKLTPEVQAQISGLIDQIKTQTGLPRELAIKTLNQVIAKVKGLDLLPGYDPLSTYWQSNVLLSLNTQGINILGNIAPPALRAIQESAKGNPKGSGRFVRAWVSALLSKQTLRDVGAGFRGELPGRVDPDYKKEEGTALSEIARGVLVPREYDPIKSVGLYFNKLFRGIPGGNKLSYLLSQSGISLRTLGAMDVVFSRLAREGYFAMKSPTYKDYLKYKADRYDTDLLKAKAEKAALEKLGVTVPKNFEYRRSDELATENKPEEVRVAARKFARKSVFQDEDGPSGIVSTSLKRALNTAASVPLWPGRMKAVNAQWTLASALHLSNKIPRNDVDVEQVFATVIAGIEGGDTLVINGHEFKSRMSTKRVLGALVDAVTNKQLIELKGDSIRPFKYISGMFVNTGAQIIDLGMEILPGIGYLDKKLGRYREFTAEEKSNLVVSQLIGTTISIGMLAHLLPGMDDEENQYVYVYGGMRDPLLREAYKTKDIKPFSLRVGDTTLSYKDWPGLSLVLGAIGELSDAAMVAKRTPENPITVGSAMQMLAVGAAYTATQLTMLKNLSVLSDAIALKDPKLADMLPNILMPFVVPYTGAARELDRFLYGDLHRPSDLTSRMIMSIPLTGSLTGAKPRLNIFGKPIKTSYIPIYSRIIGEAEPSPGMDWVMRNGYTISLPRKREKLSDKQKEQYYKYMESNDPNTFESFFDDEDQYRYIELFGPELDALLTYYSNSFPFGFDESVQKSLDKDIKRIKTSAKDQILAGQ